MSEGKWMEWKREKADLLRLIARIEDILADGGINENERDIWLQRMVEVCERYNRIPA